MKALSQSACGQGLVILVMILEDIPQNKLANYFTGLFPRINFKDCDSEVKYIWKVNVFCYLQNTYVFFKLQEYLTPQLFLFTLTPDR